MIWEFYAIIAVVLVGFRADTNEPVEALLSQVEYTSPAANEETYKLMKVNMDPTIKREVSAAMIAVWDLGEGNVNDLKVVYASECRRTPRKGAAS